MAQKTFDASVEFVAKGQHRKDRECEVTDFCLWRLRESACSHQRRTYPRIEEQF